MRTFLIAIVVTSAGVLAAPNQIPAAQTVIDDSESYAVYASLLPGEVATAANGKTRELVIQRETSTNNECTLSGAALEGEWKPVVDDFKLQNARVRMLLPDRDLHSPYTLVPRKEIMAFFTKGPESWQGFYRRYPDSGGYIEMSAVGFNASRTRAMVYIAHYCGGLCGGGAHHLLEKVDGSWREAKAPGITACMWIS